MRSLFDEMAVMMACRIASLAVGLLMIPLLLHYLKGEEFAAWALYIAIGMAFSTLEASSSNTLVRFVAPPAQEMSPEGISRVVTNMAVTLLLSYILVAPLVFLVSRPLARLIHLPQDGFFSPPELIVLIYVAAMIRSLLLLGEIVLFAGGNLRWFSISSFVLSLMTSVSSIVAAAVFLRADAIVIVSWSVQLLILAVYAGVSWRRYRWHLRSRHIDRAFVREILGHGLQLQLREWAHFFNYQFDKFLISALTGLWAVGSYEIANRAVLALRSVPHSGLGLLLPVASGDVERKRGVNKLYRETTRYGAFGALLFLGVPLAAGWYFVFAWAGEIGYYARWAFPALGLGAMAAVAAMPAALLLQAEGRADVEARAAGVAVLLNLPVSFLVIPRFGGAGAAFAIGVATTVGAVWILVAFHRLHGLSIADTVNDLWRMVRVPAMLVLTVGVLTTLSFKLWFTPLLPVTGFSADARAVPAVIACMVGGGCALFVAWSAKRTLPSWGVEFSETSARVGKDEGACEAEPISKVSSLDR